MRTSYTPEELGALRTLALGRRWLPFRRRRSGARLDAVQWFPAEHQLRQGFGLDFAQGYSVAPDPLTGVRFAVPRRMEEDAPVPLLDGAGADLRARVPEGAWVLRSRLGSRLCSPEVFVQCYLPAWWPERKRLTRDEYLAQGECR